MLKYFSKAIIMASVLPTLISSPTYANPKQSSPSATHKYSILLQHSALLTKGREEIAIGNSQEAQKLFKLALASNLNEKQMSQAHNGMCVALQMERVWDDAKTHCRKAIRLRANNWRSYNNLGNIHLEQGEYEKAFKNYNKALAISPGAYAPKFNLTITQARSGKRMDLEAKSEKPPVQL